MNVSDLKPIFYFIFSGFDENWRNEELEKIISDEVKKKFVGINFWYKGMYIAFSEYSEEENVLIINFDSNDKQHFYGKAALVIDLNKKRYRLDFHDY